MLLLVIGVIGGMGLLFVGMKCARIWHGVSPCGAGGYPRCASRRRTAFAHLAHPHADFAEGGTAGCVVAPCARYLLSQLHLPGVRGCGQARSDAAGLRFRAESASGTQASAVRLTCP